MKVEGKEWLWLHSDIRFQFPAVSNACSDFRVLYFKIIGAILAESPWRGKRMRISGGEGSGGSKSKGLHEPIERFAPPILLQVRGKNSRLSFIFRGLQDSVIPNSSS